MSYEKEDRPSQSQWLIRPSTEGAESQDGEQYHSGNSTPARKPFQNPKTAILIVATVLLYAALLIAYVLKTPSDQECHRRLSVWSPLNDAIEYTEFDFENPFAHPSIYRGPPTPELETAWDELWNVGGIRIPEDKFSRLNRTLPATGGQSFVAVNGDEGGYFALVEVFHQLHCLNLIRQYTWRDWYLRHEDIVLLPGDLSNGPVEARMHADHCIETLRLSLMCHADTTPMFIMDDPSVLTGRKADFNVHHMCADFEALRRWMKLHAVHAHRW